MMVSPSPPYSHLSSVTPFPKYYSGLPWERDIMALGEMLWAAVWDSC